MLNLNTSKSSTSENKLTVLSSSIFSEPFTPVVTISINDVLADEDFNLLSSTRR